MKIALLQLNSQSDIQANRAQIERQISALPKDVQWVLLPENFYCFGAQTALAAMADYGHIEVMEWLSQLAIDHQLYLLAGSLPVFEPDDHQRPFTRTLVFGPEGDCLGHYNKRHLFEARVADGVGAYREADSYRGGDEVVVIPHGESVLGLSICYDLRFPAHFQRLRALGAQWMVVPSAFTYVTGQAHWQTLLQARAIETASYVVGINQSGHHGKGRQTWGHSMVVDPWGQVVASLGYEDNATLIAELDFNRVAEVRSGLDSFLHRLD